MRLKTRGLLSHTPWLWWAWVSRSKSHNLTFGSAMGALKHSFLAEPEVELGHIYYCFIIYLIYQLLFLLRVTQSAFANKCNVSTLRPVSHQFNSHGSQSNNVSIISRKGQGISCKAAEFSSPLPKIIWAKTWWLNWFPTSLNLQPRSSLVNNYYRKGL